MKDIDSVAEQILDKVYNDADQLLYNMYLTLSEKHKDVKNPKFYKMPISLSKTKVKNAIAEVNVHLDMYDGENLIDYMESKIVLKNSGR